MHNSRGIYLSISRLCLLITDDDGLSSSSLRLFFFLPHFPPVPSQIYQIRSPINSISDPQTLTLAGEAATSIHPWRSISARNRPASLLFPPLSSLHLPHISPPSLSLSLHRPHAQPQPAPEPRWDHRLRRRMEGIDRAHSHRSGGGSEFFICFTARPSSSASAPSTTMRVPSSKSLMSPSRGRDSAAPSLSASLSRRLRNSGSVKGGQSPMFPAGVSTTAGGGGGRRKGCAFEAAEPSSPKVTCIGQVRVKSKKKMMMKKKKKENKKGIVVARSRSQRSGGGEASFKRPLFEQERECLPSSQSNQSWVYQLPVSICDALRALGSEFSCFLPCSGRS